MRGDSLVTKRSGAKERLTPSRLSGPFPHLEMGSSFPPPLPTRAQCPPHCWPSMFLRCQDARGRACEWGSPLSLIMPCSVGWSCPSLEPRAVLGTWWCSSHERASTDRSLLGLGQGKPTVVGTGRAPPMPARCALTTALAGTPGAATAAAGSSPGGPGHPDHCSLAGMSVWGANCPCWVPEWGLGVRCHQMTAGHTRCRWVRLC